MPQLHTRFSMISTFLASHWLILWFRAYRKFRIKSYYRISDFLVLNGFFPNCWLFKRAELIVYHRLADRIFYTLGLSLVLFLQSFSRARDIVVKNELFRDSMAAAGLLGSESGTKLYVSNLDYGVSNEDIKELFSEIGLLRRSMVHYDSNGRPNGSAEVVFARRSDALAALKRYNNVQLDGKAMKIEIVGDSTNLPVSARINVVGGGIGRERRTVVMTPRLGQVGSSIFKRFSRPNPVTAFRGRGGRQGSQSYRGRGRDQARGGGRGTFRGRGRGRGRGQGRRQFNDKSADDLDKELEEYHAEAMNIS